MFFVVLALFLIAIIWFLMPVPIRWIIKVMIKILLFIGIIVGLWKMLKKFGLLGTIKKILLVIVVLVILSFGLIWPSLVIGLFL